MRGRPQISLIELMIIIAILGIVAAIALPALRQAKERSHRSPSAVQEPIPPDGQLNTIEVSETSRSTDRSDPERWGRAFAPILPLVFGIVMILMIITAVRRQMSRRA